MSVLSSDPARSTSGAVARRPLSFTILAVYSLLLGVVTFIPQLYQESG
jgi:hypothetical protein